MPFRNYEDRLTAERGRAERNRRFIDSLKAKPCLDCGNTFPPECMDFDHTRDKQFNVSMMAYYGRERILAEVAKCDLVCANCHRIRTRRRNDQSQA